MIKLLIVGKNSYLAKNFIKFISGKIEYKAVSHNQRINFKLYDYIINFSISPKYLKEKVKDKNNIDLIIAQKIIKSRTKYIFISSRKVYKSGPNLKENSKIFLKDYYEKNKFYTEKKLFKILKKKLLILRVSNVVGPKIKCINRVHTTFLDNYYLLKKKRKKFYIINDDYKDFITTEQFSQIILKLIKRNTFGLFNVSLGQKIYLKDFLRWLDSKFYKKFIFKKTLKNDSFYLNNNKLKKKISNPITVAQLKLFVKKKICAK